MEPEGEGQEERGEEQIEEEVGEVAVKLQQLEQTTGKTDLAPVAFKLPGPMNFIQDTVVRSSKKRETSFLPPDCNLKSAQSAKNWFQTARGNLMFAKEKG